MRHAWRTASIVASLALAVAARAGAQPLFGHATSLDSMVIDADLVVIARIADLAEAGPDGRSRATLVVEETLKGDHQPGVTAPLPGPAPELAHRKGRSRRLLVAIQQGPPGEVRVVDLSGDKVEVLTADLSLLRTADGVVAAARETVRRMPGVTRIHGFGLRPAQEAILGTSWQKYYGTGGAIILIVPVDDRLEAKARASLVAKGPLDRPEAARALRYFKSEENIALMKRLLDDPGWAYARHAEENMGREERVYLTRQEAYRTLRAWGVAVEEPTTHEESFLPEKVELVAFSNRAVTKADLEGLARFPNLNHLTLTNDTLEEADLERIGRLKALQTLDLGGTTVVDAWLGRLSGLARLRVLDLGTTNISDTSVEVLAGFRGLERLVLRQTRVTDEGVARLRTLRPGLKIER